MTLDASAVDRSLRRHARPVEATQRAAHRGTGSVEDALAALAEYQNPDGGFGHGLEPDLRTPDSSAFTTSVAFQYLGALGPAAHESDVARRAVGYLLDTFVADECRWRPIAPSTADHPAAPWWGNYEDSLSWTDWGNPSGELLGHLLTWADPDEHAGVIATLTERAVDRLDEIDQPEFHELLCFQRLHAAASDELKDRLWPRLSALVSRAVEHRPELWAGYQATPLTMLDSPTSPFIVLFDRAVVDLDLQRLVDAMVGGDHWEPNWTWGDVHPDAWAVARTEWTGVITLRSLLVLERFGIVDPT